MEIMVNDEFFHNVLATLECAENMTRDKLTLQEILDSKRIDWHEDYNRLKKDVEFQRRLEATLADVVALRRKMTQWVNARKDGLPPPQNDQVQ
jgi:hypothetical protein